MFILSLTRMPRRGPKASRFLQITIQYQRRSHHEHRTSNTRDFIIDYHEELEELEDFLLFFFMPFMSFMVKKML